MSLVIVVRDKSVIKSDNGFHRVAAGHIAERENEGLRNERRGKRLEGLRISEPAEELKDVSTKSSQLLMDLIWHALESVPEPGKLKNTVDGGAWKKFDTKYPDFAKEPRNVRLGLVADGFNPFGNLSQAYSIVAQICSATLMEDDMLKAQIKVVNILCKLELIYHLALFDIMVHLVIHLPIEALEGGPIRPRWMYPFERYMKKLKGLLPQNLSFWTRNWWTPLPYRVVSGVVRSVCKPIDLRSFYSVDAKWLKKVKWDVLTKS
ncbi:F-box domain containing protein [Tanacetum coccineum]